MEQEVIVVIPARGGSKTLPHKNLRVIGNYTLLEHTIKDAMELRCPIYVSTECSTIAILAEQSGATVIRRPSELAQDDSSSEDAIIHVLKTMEVPPEMIVVFLQCTSLFRKPGDLTGALGYFLPDTLDSLYSCYELYPFVWNANRRLEYEVMYRPRRQFKSPVYVEDGSFYITRASVYYELNNRLGGRIGRWIHDKIYGLEIDDLEDLECALTLYPWLLKSGRV